MCTAAANCANLPDRPKMTRLQRACARIWLWLVLALIVILADQFTKVLIVDHYALG